MSEDIKSIYKVGDKVTVRKTYHPGFVCDDYPHGFTNSMLDRCGGKTYTVKLVRKDAYPEFKSSIKGDLEPFWYVLEGGWEVEDLCWHAAMFEESNHLVKNKLENKEMQCNKLTDQIYKGLIFKDGYAVVQRKKDNKYNWVDKDMNLLNPDWFLWCDDFSEGYAAVKRDEDHCWNWIDTNGKFLSADWMKYCSHFNEGFAAFKEDDERGNWVDKKGQILSKNWYYYCGDFHNGIAKAAKIVDDTSVCRLSWNRVVNFVNKNGDLLSPIWFRDECSSFHEGCARVKRIDDGMLNWLKEDGEFLSREWFKDCCFFREGFAVVKRENGYWNWVDKAGNLLSKNKDFYDCEAFNDGFAKIIHKNGRYSWIDKDGKVYTSKEKENFIKTGTVINTSKELVNENVRIGENVEVCDCVKMKEDCEKIIDNNFCFTEEEVINIKPKRKRITLTF